MACNADGKSPPRKKRRVGRSGRAVKVPLEVVAPQASLDGMPDNILLLIMKNLGNRLKSLIVLSRVCRRFYILHLDESVWSDVELTKESIGTKLESRQLKKIINNYLPRTLWRIKLASNAHSHSARNPTVTASIVNDLFTKCPNVKSVILENCDVSLFPSDCKLYHCETLERLTLYKCETKLRWLENIEPQWPNLTHLSLEKTAMTTDADLKCIAKHNKWAVTIRSVILRGCYRITNAGVQSLCDKLCNLALLDVSECGSAVTASATETVASFCNVIGV